MRGSFGLSPWSTNALCASEMLNLSDLVPFPSVSNSVSSHFILAIGCMHWTTRGASWISLSLSFSAIRHNPERGDGRLPIYSLQFVFLFSFDGPGRSEEGIPIMSARTSPSIRCLIIEGYHFSFPAICMLLSALAAPASRFLPLQLSIIEQPRCILSGGAVLFPLGAHRAKAATNAGQS